MVVVAAIKSKSKYVKSATLQALCLSALTLPGLSIADNAAGTDASMHGKSNTNSASETPKQSLKQSDAFDEIDYQYTIYQEGKRDTYDTAPYTIDNNGIMTSTGPYKYQTNLQPITVDSEHASSRFRFGDRTRFGFNYVQDVWSGATPWFTTAAGNFMIKANPQSLVGATYWANGAGGGQLFDAKNKPLTLAAFDTNTSTILATSPSRIQHVLGYASPEMRNQADFKLGYDFDHAALDIGGGLSVERDYLSQFGNLAGRMDFNQKRTTLNFGLSYTNSATHATSTTNSSSGTVLDPSVNVSQHQAMSMLPGDVPVYEQIIKGTREDGTISLALSQVLTKNSVLTSGVGYTRSSGYMSNPYKAVMVYNMDPNWRSDGGSGAVLPDTAFPGVQMATSGGPVAEQRPHLRNQLNWDISYRHYIEPLNAAGKVGYNFFHDDWGINAHSFDAEWRQALGDSWTLTPHTRYYSQSSASFYTPYLLYTNGDVSPQDPGYLTPLASQHFSSDQRLSSYGAISGGITLGKQLAQGLNLELGYEYYVHKGALAISSGTGDYADYHYYAASATMRVNLDQLSLRGGAYDNYGLSDWLGNLFGGNDVESISANSSHQHNHGLAPAGVMFSHMLSHAGETMVGYRYMRDTQSGNYLQGAQALSSTQLTNSQACMPLGQCTMLSNSMDMNMHMVDLMYAPTDWLNLMLMPQFMSMSMEMNMPVAMSMTAMGGGMNMSALRDFQGSGGFGDTGAYALFKLWDGDGQHLHLTQGISAPTGATNIRQSSPGGPEYYYSYGMQLGSGTWDYKPSLTYTGILNDWFWGGQVSGTHRLENLNNQGYRQGDIFQTTAWGGYKLTPWLSSTIRAVYTAQSKMVGTHTNVNTVAGVPMWMPEDNPSNYGGFFVDVGFGATVSMPYGKLAGHSLGFEWLQPVSTNFQGYQLDRAGALSATWNYKF